MTNEPQLYDVRIAELTQLIDAHLERGSLDEGNATTFDAIIDAWLRDELARLERAVAASVRDEGRGRAAADVERRHRLELERAAEERRRTAAEEQRATREAAAKRRLASHEERVRATSERLERSREEVVAARALLLGAPQTTTREVDSLASPGGGNDPMPDDDQTGA